MHTSTLAATYIDHHSWLKRWLLRRLGDREQAADLAQDTFVRLLTTERLPAKIDEPRAFLTTVARRLMLNHLRRQKIEQAYLEALAQAPQQVIGSPEQRAIVLETLTELDLLLDGLPLPVRRAFLMSQLEGLSHAQIGAALAVSIPTVKRYIAKALQRCFFADASFNA